MLHNIKKIIKNNKFLYMIAFKVYKNILYIYNSLKEIPEKRVYKKQIKDELAKNEIIIKMDFGGLGDSLKYSTLPELLKKQYNIDFYLHESNKDIFRHNDILELFMKNPYFKGFKKSDKPFEFKIFQSDNENIIATYEKHLKLKGSQLPKIYYKPQLIDKYKNTILVDTNQVTGAKFGYQYNDEDIQKIIVNDSNLINCQIEYVEPKNQDLFRYIDMIFSCKYFICYLSGGSVLAAALNKKSSVIIPDNLDVQGRGVFPWLFSPAKNVNYLHKMRRVI